MVQILTSTNGVVANYSYDAWGNLLEVTDASGSAITSTTSFANINPIRYRGYYYDSETGFYYLKSRYYDPQNCRFISTDGQMDLGDGTTNLNLFAYCGNDPINNVDPNGNEWYHWVLGALVVVGCAAATVATCGGFGPAATSLFLAGSGAASMSTSVTVATYAFIGSASVYGGEVISAEANSNSWDDFAAQGNWRTVASTSGGALWGGYSGYQLDKALFGNYNSDSCTGKVCFVAGTQVLVSEGVKAIEEIKAGDLVWAQDTETGNVELKSVVQTFINETNELIHISLNGNEIITTPTHPFYSPIKGWTSAVNLRAGDILVSVNGEYVVLEKVQHELLENSVKVYNFEVEDFHTYFVGNDNVLVHNSCRPENNIYMDTRRQAFREAKRQSGIPVSIQPENVFPNINRSGGVVPGRVYDFGYMGSIRDDTAGHFFNDGTVLGPHFNGYNSSGEKFHIFYNK